MNNNIFYDKAFRQKLLTDPKATMSEVNSEFISDVEVVVKKNTATLSYFVMPAQSVLDWDSDSALDSINAAGTTGTGSTAGTAGTVSTVTGCFSTLSSAGSVGTAGSK